MLRDLPLRRSSGTGHEKASGALADRAQQAPVARGGKADRLLADNIQLLGANQHAGLAQTRTKCIGWSVLDIMC